MIHLRIRKVVDALLERALVAGEEFPAKVVYAGSGANGMVTGVPPSASKPKKERSASSILRMK